ncbi:hypothetical protein SLS56_012212, partial [Neofusicoccum ribis]
REAQVWAADDDTAGLFQPVVGRLIATAEATVGRTEPVITSLGQSPWQLDLEQLIDAFGPATMLSYDFLSNLRDLSAGAACSWDDALPALPRSPETWRSTCTTAPPDWNRYAATHSQPRCQKTGRLND